MSFANGPVLVVGDSEAIHVLLDRSVPGTSGHHISPFETTSAVVLGRHSMTETNPNSCRSLYKYCFFIPVIQVATVNASGERDPESPILELPLADRKQKAIARNSPPQS